MRLPDPDASRAVLIGTANYEPDSGFTSFEEIKLSLLDFAEFLKATTGLRNVDVVLDPPDERTIAARVTAAARDATDLLLVYFVGHGVAVDNELHLTHARSRAEDADITTLRYSALRSRIKQAARGPVVVILDCCHSGKAFGREILATNDDLLRAATDIDGAFVLTATDEKTKFAVAQNGGGRTAFTAMLLDVLTAGVPSAERYLSLSVLYRELRERLPAANLPKPKALQRGTAAELCLAPNTAWTGETTPAQPNSFEELGIGIDLSQIRDPFALEVHRPIQIDGQATAMPPLPPYVRRAHDSKLDDATRAALRGNSALAVLVAESSTGKTRACWEALEPLRQEGGWKLWHPLGPTNAEATLTELASLGPRTIVWLNEMQYYLDSADGTGERIAAQVRSILSTTSRSPVLILGTLWPEHWTRLTTRPVSGPDRYFHARALLSGNDISVPAAFLDRDRESLNDLIVATQDPRLAAAAKGAPDGKVAQYLAGVPELISRYQYAPPEARALVEAAIEARRRSRGLTFTRSFLAAAAPAFFSDTEWNALSDDWLERGLDYATVRCKGIAGLLSLVRPRPSPHHKVSPMDADEPMYRLADFLDQQSREQAISAVVADLDLIRNGSEISKLTPLLSILIEAGLSEVEVLVEHKLPRSPKRVDVVLCGVHPDKRTWSYVLIELEPWSRAETVAGNLISIAGRSQLELHPAARVDAYCRYLVDFMPSAVRYPMEVNGIAHIHNARSADIRHFELHGDSNVFSRTFALDEQSEMIRTLRSLLDHECDREQNQQAANHFRELEFAPTKSLLTVAAREVQDREQYVLLDEQRVAHDVVLHALHRAMAQHQQTVVVVSGGPGTGKSVIALSLLGELARQGRRVHHATGSSAFTRTMRKVVGSRNARVQSLFKYFNSYTNSEPRELDVLLCDEAHRIRESSVTRFTASASRARARRQIDELISVAWVPVFLLDENQAVRPGEIGSLDEIAEATSAAGCALEIIQLDGQFRYGGWDVFDTWIRQLLGISNHPPAQWSLLGNHTDIQVSTAASPWELEAWLRRQRENHGGTARITAGYCWPWSDPVSPQGGTKMLVNDVKIGEWERPWTAKPDKRVPDAPDSYYWASDDRGFGQVGSVYTAQGFEYDWAGVIFGRDYVRRGDNWVAQHEFSHDPAVHRASNARFDELIRNTYKVLLTRGMQGVCIYSADPETQAYLETMTR
ncbi:caspase, EACC1-associated type [Nocardia sp. NPDC004582]